MMATIDVVTCRLSTDTRWAKRLALVHMPLVALRLLSVDRATAIAMRFVKVSVTPEKR